MADGDPAPPGEPWKLYQKQPAAPAAPGPWTRYQHPPATAGDSTKSSAAEGTTPPTDTSWWGALGKGAEHGVTNLFYGGAQAGARMGPDEGGAAFADPAELEARKQTVDKTVQEREKKYQEDPSVQANPWTAWGGNLAGEIAATVPLMVLPGMAPTLPARMVGAGVAAIPIGTARPVTDTENYGEEKVGQVAGEVGGAAVGQAVGEKVIAPAAKYVISWGKWLMQNEEQRAASKAAAEAAKEATAKETATKQVTGKFAKAQKSGLVPGDVIKEMAEAEATGQPLTLMDIDPFPGSPIRRDVGNIYRGPGGAGRELEQFQEARTYGQDPETLRSWQGNRLNQLFLDMRDKLSSLSAFRAGKAAAEKRSADAKPLFDELREGWSTAPLEHQFEREFTAATTAEAAAAQRLREAQTRLVAAQSKQQTSAVAQREAATTPAQLRTRETAELGKQTVTGAELPEHPPSAWNTEQRVAAKEAEDAAIELNRVRAVKEDVRTRLKQAQEDGTANAPGATWSPRLQEFLDKEPVIRKGLAEAWRREQREALAEGRPMNPKDYAIVGFDEAGDPIVGKVPNMRALMLAKQGLDHELLHGEGMYDEFGRKTDKFRVLDKVRRAFLGELDRLTDGKYAEAREGWAEQTRIMQALRDGREAFARPPRGLSPEEFAEEWHGMSASEQEHFKLAAIDKLREDMDFSRLGGDQSRVIVNNPAAQQKLRMMFGDTPKGRQEFDQAMRYVKRERNMWQTGTSVMRGAQTAERLATDEQAKEEAAQAVLHASHGLWHLVKGNAFAAAHSMRRAASHIGWGEDPERVNLAKARLYTLPAGHPDLNLRLGPQGHLQIGPEAPQPSVLPFDASKLQLSKEYLKAAAKGVPGRLPSSMYYSWPGSPPRP